MKSIYNGNSKKSGIYKIENTITAKKYIGSAKVFKVRLYKHVYSLRKGIHHNKHLQHDFNKYGEDVFVYEIIEVVEGNRIDRLITEQKYINKHFDGGKFCYNHEKNIKELNGTITNNSYKKSKICKNKKIKADKNIIKPKDYKECIYCDLKFRNNVDGALTKHLEQEHNKTLKEYIIDLKYQGKAPKCVCGFCNKDASFYRGNFKKYANYHQRFEWKKQKYIEFFGIPKCKNCQVEINKWKRGAPNKFCSFKCVGKMNGFSLPKVQKKIAENVYKKYGVKTISLLPEIKKKISDANKKILTK